VRARKVVIPPMDVRHINLKCAFSAKEEEGTFEGFASVFNNIDLNHYRIERGAFKKTLSENRTFPLLWQHRFDELIGVINEAQETDKGLYIQGKLAMNVQRAREAYELLKLGALTGLSIGGEIIKAGAIDKSITTIKEIRLLECSLVTIPANQEARVTVVNAVIPYKDRGIIADRQHPWDAAAVVKACDVEQLRIICAYYDESAPDVKSSYKLPHHEPQGNGEYPAVFRACANAIARINAGTVDIPDDELEDAYRHVARHYSQWGVDPPEFKASFDDTLDILFSHFEPTEKIESHSKPQVDETKQLTDIIARLDRWAQPVGGES